MGRFFQAIAVGAVAAAILGVVYWRLLVLLQPLLNRVRVVLHREALSTSSPHPSSPPLPQMRPVMKTSWAAFPATVAVMGKLKAPFHSGHVMILESERDLAFLEPIERQFLLTFSGKRIAGMPQENEVPKEEMMGPPASAMPPANERFPKRRRPAFTTPLFN